MQSTTLLCLAAPLLSAGLLAQAPDSVLPRQAIQLPAPQLPVFQAPLRPLDLNLPDARALLTVKFRDEVKARVLGNSLRTEAGYDLGAVKALLEAYGVSLKPLIALDEAAAHQAQEIAKKRSGRSQPDLLGMFRVNTPQLSLRQVEELGSYLHGMPSVEFCQLDFRSDSLPADYPPTSDLFQPDPDHFAPDPGMDMDYAWSIGARGAGVRITDIEEAWLLDHEDLEAVPIVPESGQTPAPELIHSFPSFVLGSRYHGTAVMGFLFAEDNSYGVTGIVPDAEGAAYPAFSVEEGPRLEQAIIQASIQSALGDVILLERQGDCPCTPGIRLAPAETVPTVWVATRFAVDYGRVVVAAAGNGREDLDGPFYQSYRDMGDSGAIIVGAGTADIDHERVDLFSGYGSTYGSRVDVQAWGEQVTTLGFGDLALFGGDILQSYTDTFNGTSSASPFIAGACASLQGEVLARGHAPMTSEQLRSHLKATGIPQGSSVAGNVGPFPDMREAHEQLCPEPSITCPGAPNSFGSGAVLSISGSTSVPANDLVLEVDGVPPSQLGEFFMGTGQGSLPYGNGTVCLGGSLYRLPFVTVDGLGHAELALDLQVAPATLITVGSSWHFQFVYADPGTGAGYNASSALVISFCP